MVKLTRHTFACDVLLVTSLLFVPTMASAQIATDSDASGYAIDESIAEDPARSNQALSNQDRADEGALSFAPLLPDQPAPRVDVVLPPAALNEKKCRDAFDGVEVIAAMQAADLPKLANPQLKSVDVPTLCFGSGWAIDSGVAVPNSVLALEFSPDHAVCKDGSCEGYHFRSSVRLGLNQLISEGKEDKGVFFFAGADDKTLMWRPTSGSAAQGLADRKLLLSDSVTVGDVEAGVAMVGERTELSVSYIHRETSYRIDNSQKLSDTEGFIGVVLRSK